MSIRTKLARTVVAVIVLFVALLWSSPLVQAAPPPSEKVLIGNFLRSAPCGIAWVVGDSAAFVVDTQGPYVAGTAAPDDSYHRYKFAKDGANVVLEWGRIGNNVVGRISSDKAVDLILTFSSGWPGWTSEFSATPDGEAGIAQTSAGPINWRLRTSPAPKVGSSTAATITISPDSPVRFVAGLGRLPDIAAVDIDLSRASRLYEAMRPQASGDLGDFVGAIADNMNNSRLYASDNHVLAHSVSRTWADTPNGSPYFCWDSFFTANLAALDDPKGAQRTVLAILSCQSPEGLVPNFGHWRGGASMDRSQPPVGSLCVWKMHQRYPDDRDFLKVVYPKLVLWHDWWSKYRNAKQDGLLEWGSSNGDFQDAQYETGWDDNLHYAGAHMTGSTMNCYSIDLSSMWAMDAHYLALIAAYLGYSGDAMRFHNDEAAMIHRINTSLWNDSLSSYCSRYWADTQTYTPVDDSAFGDGFKAEYYSDENLQRPAASHHDPKISFDWGGNSPIDGVPAVHWSARWTGTFTAPSTGNYEFSAAADDGVRVFVDGKKIIDDWSVHMAREETGDVSITKGRSVSVVVEYYQHELGSQLKFSVQKAVRANGAFLTRLTPMNFYPLSAGAPDTRRAARVLAVLTDPSKFWGPYLLPTVAYDDPDYGQQEYWRGDVWGPTNYIAWVGIKKYASLAQISEFADRNVNLFEREWSAHGVCSENYLSTNGTHNHDPHYTWGALLNLVGLESVVDVDDGGAIILNGHQTRRIILRNIPLMGHFYDVRTRLGMAELISNGKIAAVAKNSRFRYMPR